MMIQECLKDALANLLVNGLYCQAQPQLQVKLSLKAELALIYIFPTQA